MLSVVIPAKNESESLRSTIPNLASRLRLHGGAFEIVVVDDHSTDASLQVLEELSLNFSELVTVSNQNEPGFGSAVRFGLSSCNGDIVSIFMADLSDDPADLLAFWHKIEEGYDCVFGNRWGSQGGGVVDYPFAKKLLNRSLNLLIRLVFCTGYSDCTNAMKMYRKSVIDACMPLRSVHFDLTVELPLRAMNRGFSFVVLPNSWRNRSFGISKLHLKEMGSKYLRTLSRCFIDRIAIRYAALASR